MILNAFFYLFLILGTALWALGIQVLAPCSTNQELWLCVPKWGRASAI